MNLKELIETADRGTVPLFNKNGEVLPFYHIITKEGKSIVMPIPQRVNKDTGLNLMRRLMAVAEAESYVFITEAWTASGTVDKADALKEYSRNNSLEHYPGRKEELLYAAESVNEGMMMASREIKRDSGKPELSELKFLNTQSMEGRMVGLLATEGRLS